MPAPAPLPDDVPAERSARSATALERAFTELSDLVVGSEPLRGVLSRVVELARACVVPAGELSVTLVTDGGRARTAASTHLLATTLDEHQYDDRAGPCLDAARSGRTVRLDDLSREESYPELARAAARRGVRSIVSTGMPQLQHLAGGINAYVRDDALLDEDAVRLLQVFAGYASIALAHHALHEPAMASGSSLPDAVRSRALVEQARGVVMSRTGCSADQALEHLLSRAGETQRELRDVALEVVAQLVPPQPPSRS